MSMCVLRLSTLVRDKTRAPAAMGGGSVRVPRLRDYVVRGSSAGVGSSWISCSMFEMPVRERT
jgi:hypothetical protein